MYKSKKIAIIGSGIGGLSAAIRLANTGYTVDIYEQNSSPGGKANQIQANGFRFDTGPSLLTMPFILVQLFESVGKKINDYIDIKPLSILCKYFYQDGTIINAYSDINKFADEIQSCTNDNSESVLRYLSYSSKIYELTADLFLFNDFSNIKNLLNLSSLKTLFHINKIDPFRTMHNANTKYFNDSKTIQLFDRYATYNGSDPFKVPATLNIIQHVEYVLGGFIVQGGIYSIVSALHKLAFEMGVNINFNTKVEKIIYTKKIVHGIEYIKNGRNERKEYDVILSNADVYSTYKFLLGDNWSHSSKRYSKLEASSSALVFYWGIEGEYSHLEIHNILFSKDYQEEFKDIFDKKKCTDDPTIYIYISSKYNKSDAPNGYENWFVMINVPYSNGHNWDDEINKARTIILRRIQNQLNIDLTNKIKYERVLTPQKIEKETGSYKGSIYGISSNNKSAAFLRQKNRSRDYQGLYFCGGSSHPGGGIPLVLLSGKIAAELIKEDYD